MLKWGSAGFNVQGVMNQRAKENLGIVQEFGAYAAACCEAPDTHLKKGGWGERVVQGDRRGEIPAGMGPSVLLDYIVPSLDTTILGTGAVLMLLAKHPDQWELLLDNTDLIPNAINEALRLESPARGFTRYVTGKFEFEGVALKEGDRVWTALQSANRDEIFWNEPEKFDVQRKNAGQHVAFGYGAHICAGMHLAKLEIKILLEQMIKSGIKTISLAGDPVYRPNNTLYGLESLPLAIATH